MLLDLLFPTVRAEVLRALFVDTRREMYVREIARASDLALRNVQRELAVLRRVGVGTSRTKGYHVFFRANRDRMLFLSLQQLAVNRTNCLPGVRQERSARGRPGAHRTVEGVSSQTRTNE